MQRFNYLGRVADEIIFIARGFLRVREQPYVRMVNFVAHNAGTNRFVKDSLLCFGDLLDHFKVVSYLRHIPYPTVMFLGNYLDVS